MKISKIAKSLNQYSKTLFWILFLLIFIFQLLKLLVFYQGDLYLLSGDGPAYIGLNENLFNNGVYEFNGSYTKRMPGFTPLYLSIRYFFSQHMTLQIISIFMLLFYATSVVYFSQVLRKFLKKGVVFFILLVSLLGISDYITYWGFPFCTESLAGSSLLLGFAFFLKGEMQKKNFYYFLSGSFMCWVVFLRPFMIVIWILMAFYLIYKYRHQFRKKLLFPLSLFVSMFIVSDTIWITRNYTVVNKFVPLQYYPDFSTHLLSYRAFIKSFGGDAVEWNPNSEGLWFQSQIFLEKGGFTRPSDDIFPKRIFNDTFTLDSLKELRQDYWDANNDSLSQKTRQSKSELFVQKTTNFLKNYKSRESFDYYIGSRLTLLRKFIIHPYTYYLSLSNDSFIQFAIKALIYVINAFVIIVGFISLIWFTIISLIKRKFKLSDNLFIMIPLFLIALFPIYYGFIEYRFIVLAFPFLAFYSVLSINKIFENKI